MAYGVYVAEWLALHSHHHRYSSDYQSPAEDMIYFTNNYPWPPFGLKPGWKSGLAQGTAAECFIEAYSYTHNGTFADLARKSIVFLKVPIAAGGVRIQEAPDRWWYEEYPREPENPQPQVLNGHQFVLLSVNKYLQEINSNDPEVRQIFDYGLNALKFDAVLYDNGQNNSYYDREWHPALKYHKTHVINFERLYNVTADEELLRVKKVFEE
jgi:hypothetical protein